MLNKGIYAAVVVPVETESGETACQFGHSSQKGTPQVAVCFEVLRGPDAGKRMSWIGYLTEKAEERAFKTLRLCGFEGDDLGAFADQRPTNEVQIDVQEERDDQGRIRARIAWVNDPSFGGGMKMANALAGAELRKFGAQFKSKLKALPAVKTVEAKREPPSADPAPAADDGWRGNDDPDPPAAPLGDDGIPF
jgi:hypothetical protein